MRPSDVTTQTLSWLMITSLCPAVKPGQCWRVKSTGGSYKRCFEEMNLPYSDLSLPVQLVLEPRHVTGAGVRRAQQLEGETETSRHCFSWQDKIKRRSVVLRRPTCPAVLYSLCCTVTSSELMNSSSLSLSLVRCRSWLVSSSLTSQTSSLHTTD